MRKIVLFGAGQAGRMALRLAATDCEVLCFADNDPVKHGKEFCGVPVLPPEQALGEEPDAVILCVVDAVRSEAMERQLRDLCFGGRILTLEMLRYLDARSACMRMLAEQIREMGIPGEVAELGVYRGAFAATVSRAFPDRRIYLYDTFTGFCGKDLDTEERERFSGAKAGDFSDTGIELVRSVLPYPEQAVFRPGYFPDSFREEAGLRFAFVSVDADLYEPTAAALPVFWEHLSEGGVLMLHDYDSRQYSGVKKAADAFCAARGILPYPVCDLHGTVVIRK